jgi:AcrR family transcriptional regulator
MSETSNAVTSRRARSDGERSRRAILEHAARLATLEGLEGLSLARLADEVGMSKSGLFAHFRSKEELQLATIETASGIFDDVVVRPALAEPDPLDRLRALGERFLLHVGDAVFPGGCFFASAAAELDTRPGPVRDRALAVVGHWTELLEQTIAEARDAGRLSADVEPGQLAFELHAFLLLGNARFVAGGGGRELDRARQAVADRLERAVA